MTLTELKKIAESATPGPWRWMSRNTLVGDYGPRPVVLTSPTIIQMRNKDSGLLVELSAGWNDPTFIATFNPARVLKPLEQLEIAKIGEVSD